MHRFKIEVIFRQHTAFTRHNIQNGSDISGVIELKTDRCDVEPILADYNANLYKIIDCDYKAQIMSGFRQIPLHYYKTEE